MDSTREIRAMMMASFPCPPLAMEGSSRFPNSHDMLAYLVDVAARRNVKKENEERQRSQERLLHDFIVCALPGSKSEEETWEAMTHFTRQYMMTYSPVMHET